LNTPKTDKNAPAHRQETLKRLPSVESILLDPGVSRNARLFSREYIAQVVSRNVERVRRRILKGALPDNSSRRELLEHIVSGVEADLKQASGGTLIPVINATGVILHTGLGRAPLPDQAVKSVQRIIKGYSALEINRTTGQRGRREQRLEEILCFLSGAEAATVVNNNAAAVFITLNTLAKGREVIVSRGELVEIGGSFRMPEIMAASGAVLKEVGTTNKTRLADYQKALNDTTGAILVVHSSNFKVMGFSESVPFSQLSRLAHTADVPVIYDLGGGVLYDLRQFGLPYEPVVAEIIKQGADVATFSGDKVMGGPQSGIIVGRKRYLDAVRKNPIARAVRCDKLILAALEGTTNVYKKGEKGFRTLPVMSLLLASRNSVRKKAEKLLAKIAGKRGGKIRISLKESEAEAGSGALPLERIPSYAVCLWSQEISPEKIAGTLRSYTPPVFGYIRDDRVYLDMRTVFTRHIQPLADAVNRLLADSA